MDTRWVLKLYPDDNIKSLIQRVERQIGTGSIRLKFVSYRIGCYHEKLSHKMTDFRVDGIENAHKSLIRTLATLYCDWKKSKTQKEWFKIHHVHGMHTLTLVPEESLTNWQRKQIEFASFSDNPRSQVLDQTMRKTFVEEILELEQNNTIFESDSKMDSNVFETPIITGATLSSSSHKTRFGYLTSHEHLKSESRKIQQIFHAWKSVIDVPENIFPHRKTKLAYANMKIFLEQSFQKGEIKGLWGYDQHIWDHIVSFLVSNIKSFQQTDLFMISYLFQMLH